MVLQGEEKERDILRELLLKLNDKENQRSKDRLAIETRTTQEEVFI